MIIMFDSAIELFPGQSNGEFGWMNGKGLVIQKGKGSHVWDTADNEYIDMSMAWGSVLLGHAYPSVLEKVKRAMNEGTNFACLNKYTLQLAERIQNISPCIESLRFVASGTEATMMCCRVAREYTGKPKIMKFDGAYHGQHPIGIAGMVGSAKPNLHDKILAGTSDPSMTDMVVLGQYNDMETTTRVFEAHKGEIAGILVEPIHRCLKPQNGFLSSLRSLASDNNIPLIFDEVVTGFRLALGGAQEYYNVQPDLIAYGKALGGGFPIGVYGGHRDIMDVVNESRYSQEQYTWSASTLGGNPISCSAALATITELEQDGVYSKLHDMGKVMRQTIGSAFESEGMPVYVLGEGPLAQYAISKDPVHTQKHWIQSDRNTGSKIMFHLLKNKIFLNPMGTKFYCSLTHTPRDIEQFGQALVTSIQSLRS